LCTVVCNSDNTLTHVSKSQIPISSHRIAAFCNGLFCLANYDDELSHIIYLWNPSVGKFKKLIAETRLSGILDGVNFGLAYHPQNNDFKLLRLVCYGEKPSSVAEIYTLSTDSWRKVMLSGDTVSGHFGSVVHLFKSNTVFCNGALHSMSFTHQHNYILAFDVDDESFRAIMLPQNCFDGVLRQLLRLAVFKGSLAFIVLGRDFNDNLLCKCDIWVMWEYGVDDSWTRIRVPMDLVHNIYCCTDNGEILIRNGTGLVSFELESRNENIIASDNVTWVGYTANCMESLVLLDGVSVSSSN
jgi:F-box interacting protein